MPSVTNASFRWIYSLIGHTTDDQQGYCRNFYDVLDWVHDPKRRVTVKVTTPPDVPQEYEMIYPDPELA